MKKRTRILAALLTMCVSISMLPFCTKAAEIPEDGDPGDYRLNGKIAPEFYDIPASAKARAVINNSKYQHASKFKDGYEIQTGIDVSYHQGNIDWKKVKAAGVQFAIIRAGYRSYGEGKLYPDKQVDNYIPAAINAGIPVGAYIFSQAITEKEAREEADYIISKVSKYKLKLPIVLDYEYVTPTLGRLATAKLSRAKKTKICNAFCARVASKGYTPMVYANRSMLTNDMYADQIDGKYMIWLAQYNTKVTYGRTYEYWQYSPTGRISGINDNNVDMNFRYVKQQETLKIKKTTQDSITMQWDPIEHASGYEVFKKNTADKYVKIATIEDADATTYTDTGLGKGEAGTYKVRAFLEEDAGEDYSPFTPAATGVTGIDGTALSAKGTALNRISLGWEQAADASGYIIQRYDSVKKSYTTIKTVTSPKTLSYTDADLDASKTYTYRIRAYKSVSGVKGYSGYTEAKAVTKKAETGRVSVSSVNFRKGPSTSYKSQGTLTRGKTVSVTGARGGWYKVTAKLNGTKKTGYVMKSYIKTGAGARIGFPSLKTQAVSKSKIKLSWKQIIGVDGYEIVRYNTKKKAYKKIKTLTNPKTVSYTDKGLKKRTKYKYKIRAYQKNGTKKVYGFYSNPKNGMTR